MLSMPALRVATLTCERRADPLGIDMASPRLAWVLTGDGQNRRQTAFEIRVGTKEMSSNLWSSGKRLSDESAGVAYGGKPLASSQRVYWQVRVWDEANKASAWSRTGTWTAGILSPQDWKAAWIGGGSPSESLLLRKEFSVKKSLKSAILYVTGLGQVEARLNGSKVGDDLLTPGWTDYRKTVLYDTYDVTRLLKSGANAVGLMLGNGMDNVHVGRYTKFTGSIGPQRGFAQIRLLYSDGSTDTVATDPSWSAHAGPITFSSVYGGEDFDQRLEPKGWAAAGFKEIWPHAVALSGPGGTLKGLGAPPVRALGVLKAVATKTISPTVSVVDLGQNASIMVRLTLSGPAGSTVRVTPAEMVKPDGTVDRSSVGGGEAYWQVTLAGGRTTYLPHFFYHGARYLQVVRIAGPEGLPTVESTDALIVGSTASDTGAFACSSDLLNRIRTLVDWAQRNNTVSLLTDCPHRERLGWLEQDHLNGPSLRYERDLATLFAKIVRDTSDAQRPNGLVPNIAPEYTVFSEGFVDSPEWGSAAVLIPWQQYLWHRDRGLLASQYGAMKRYVEYLRSTAVDGIVSHGLGDWFDRGPKPPGEAQLTPNALTATAFYYQDLAILADTAAILGRSTESAGYLADRDAVRDSFNANFFDSAKGYYATGSQTANAVPLVMGLVDSERRAGVLAQVVAGVQADGNTSGDIGLRYVLRALAEGGRSDVIFAMTNRTDVPGYGYQIAKGATSLTEAWDATPKGSQDHFMLGPIIEWFYGDLAGIQPLDGFHHFLIRPTPVAGLSWAKASYRSEYGPIESGWQIVGSVATYDVAVPPNSSATLQFPGRASFEVGSGQYRFTFPIRMALAPEPSRSSHPWALAAVGGAGAVGGFAAFRAWRTRSKDVVHREESQ